MNEESWANYCYADEVIGFWDEAKSYNYKKGNIKTDCDAKSVRLYEQMMEWLNGRTLPNGNTLNLEYKGKFSLMSGNISLTGDNMFTRFCGRVPQLTESLEKKKGVNWESYQQQIIRSGWQIGGEIVFPCHRNSLNGMRGLNRKIMDRFDLTLECIKNYYEGKGSPLSWVIEADRERFEQFVSFSGFLVLLISFCLTTGLMNNIKSLTSWGPEKFFPKPLKNWKHGMKEWRIW